MQVITIESEAFQKLLEKIIGIEQYVKKTSNIFTDLEETLELTSRELMDILNVSKSTLYRWRKDRTVKFRYEKNGNVFYSYIGLLIAIKTGSLSIPNTNKAELLARLSDFKEKIITNSLWHNEMKEKNK